MPILPLFGLGTQGKSPTVTAERHLNLYAEFVPDADKTKVAFYGTPGWTLFSSENGDTPVRGWIAVDTLIYYVHLGTLYSINNAGVRVSRGMINTIAGKVDMAFDGAVILIVDGTNGYTYTVATTTLTQISDIHFPNGANTCAWVSGQFVVDSGDGSDVFWISPDGTAWDALDFASAESAPDGLVRVFVDHGEVLLFGTGTLEPWGNVGAQDFPFAPIQGAIQEIGLAARWSLVKFDSAVAFLGKNKQGQVQVYRMDGYNVRPISSQEVDANINGYASVSDAVMMSYVDRGHPFLVISFPGADKSWMYDGSTNLWSPRESGLNGDRYAGELAIDFVNKIRISDYSSGNIYNLDATKYTENGTLIAREIVGKHFFRNYDRVVVDELRVDFETGVGLSGNPVSSGINYLSLPGGAGAFAAAPDSVPLDLLGAIGLRVYVALDDWTPAAECTLIAKLQAFGQGSWMLNVTTGGFLKFYYSTDGTNFSAVTSTVPVPAVSGAGIWVRFDAYTIINTNIFQTAPAQASTPDEAAWTQLGASVSASVTLFQGTSQLEIGSSFNGAFNNVAGKIYQALVVKELGAAPGDPVQIIAFFNAENEPFGAATILATTGETYTMHGAASIAGSYVRATTAANPQAMLQYSKDNGRTWSAEWWQRLGAIGQYLARVVWRRLGIGRDWLFKIRVTDPVKVVITGASVRAQDSGS